LILSTHLFSLSFLHLPTLSSFPTRRSSDLLLLHAHGQSAIHGWDRGSEADLAPNPGSQTAPFPAARHLERNRGRGREDDGQGPRDRKSTRLNSSHQIISYAVFCLKKKT